MQPRIDLSASSFCIGSGTFPEFPGRPCRLAESDCKAGWYSGISNRIWLGLHVLNKLCCASRVRRSLLQGPTLVHFRFATSAGLICILRVSQIRREGVSGQCCVCAPTCQEHSRGFVEASVSWLLLFQSLLLFAAIHGGDSVDSVDF